MSALEGGGRGRLQELLIRYKQGDLLDKERQEIDELLANSSEKERKLWEESVAYDADDTSASATDDALARLDAASDAAETQSTVKPWVKSLLFTGTAVVLGLVLWGAYKSVNEVSKDLYSGTSAPVFHDRPFIVVSFNDNSSMKEITETLYGLGLEISSGPLSGGVYRVIIPASAGSEYDAITATLEQNTSVNWLVAGRRPAGD